MTILALNIDQLVVAINYSEDKHTHRHTLRQKKKGGGHWVPADSSVCLLNIEKRFSKRLFACVCNWSSSSNNKLGLVLFCSSFISTSVCLLINIKADKRRKMGAQEAVVAVVVVKRWSCSAKWRERERVGLACQHFCRRRRRCRMAQLIEWAHLLSGSASTHTNICPDKYARWLITAHIAHFWCRPCNTLCNDAGARLWQTPLCAPLLHQLCFAYFNAWNLLLLQCLLTCREMRSQLNVWCPHVHFFFLHNWLIEHRWLMIWKQLCYCSECCGFLLHLLSWNFSALFLEVLNNWCTQCCCGFHSIGNGQFQSWNCSSLFSIFFLLVYSLKAISLDTSFWCF